MRKYKFRGKRVDNGEWVYGEIILISPDDITDHEIYIIKE